MSLLSRRVPSSLLQPAHTHLRAVHSQWGPPQYQPRPPHQSRVSSQAPWQSSRPNPFKPPNNTHSPPNPKSTTNAPTFRPTNAPTSRPNTAPAFSRPNPTAPAPARSKPSSRLKPIHKHPRDEDIPHPLVHLIDRTTGQICASPPSTVPALLATLDRKEFYLELVTATPQPLVKIISRKAEYDRLKEAKVRAREVRERNVQKEVQLTWGMAGRDVDHKVERVRGELGKGRKVDLVFARSTGKGQGGGGKGGVGRVKMTREMMQERVEEVVGRVLDVGKEWKPREFRGGLAVVYLQGMNVAVNEEKAKQKEKERQRKADDVDDDEGFVA